MTKNMTQVLNRTKSAKTVMEVIPKVEGIEIVLKYFVYLLIIVHFI